MSQSRRRLAGNSVVLSPSRPALKGNAKTTEDVRYPLDPHKNLSRVGLASVIFAAGEGGIHKNHCSSSEPSVAPLANGRCLRRADLERNALVVCLGSSGPQGATPRASKLGLFKYILVLGRLAADAEDLIQIAFFSLAG
jgi:hypothetical protein